MNKQNAADFSQGSVGSRIMAQAIPLSLAEIVQLLYNIVDRIFLGHLPDGNTLALTGVGLIFPVVSIVAAFTSLYSSGGAPIFAMARGRKDEERALQIQGTVFALLLGSSLALTALCYLLKRPLLFLFGASEDSFVFADAYLKIYLLGTPFTMLATGMNPFINAQGRPKIGMMTTVIGAVLNLALDPLFIYGFNMGVTGAAVATVISQAVSCIWVLRFLSGPKSILPLRRREARIYPYLLKDILSLGVVGFIMKFTNSLVQIACNKMLSIHGGDLYVGVMTVINAIRDVFTLPASGITDGARPVLSYNYGAGQMQRVRAGIRFMSAAAMVYTFCAWLFAMFQPRLLCRIFTPDEAMVEASVRMLRVYFAGFFFQSFQFCGQSVFQSLGWAKYAITFSLLRKVVIVVPLTLLLSIAETRADVPFTILMEVLIMEFSFYLINEAGTRIPSQIGSTVSIVGALVLGQAAVSASIISPILVILVAITGLGNYAAPNYGFGLSIVLYRVLFVLAGAALGLYGVLLMLVALSVRLCGIHSFGVPYLAPVAPKRPHGPDILLRLSLRRQQHPMYYAQRGSWMKGKRSK